MKVIGITGGVGAGKSSVLSFLKETCGAQICQLDEVAKKLQKSTGECFRQIVELFGEEVVGADGELERQKLAEMVFSDSDKLKQLNSIVHPAVYQWVLQDIEEKKQLGCHLYVLEAALLPDAGYDCVCEEMWYIYTEDSVRRQRLKISRGYSEDKITNMIKVQPKEERFRESCHVVIDNSGTFENTKKQIGELL